MDQTDKEVTILDNGGSRSGKDRRQNKKAFKGQERRFGEDRRQQGDRRSGLKRRKEPDRRNINPDWDGSRIERRDAFRIGLSGNKRKTP